MRFGLEVEVISEILGKEKDERRYGEYLSATKDGEDR